VDHEASQSSGQREHHVNTAASLRHELSQRAKEFARVNRLPYRLTYGQSPTICFERYAESRHGNFLPSTYAAILKNPNWRGRLQKVHTQGRKSLPRLEDGIWRELDACASSDALLMNVFCYPGVLRDGRICAMLNVKPPVRPNFGFRARVPLENGKFDRTEVDLRLGDLLIEAKLTEGDFQRAPKQIVDAYRDFNDLFETGELPQTMQNYCSYQLIRNVLAAHNTQSSSCVLTDARRPELIESWYAVMKCIRPVDLRIRCKVLTWQELAKPLPERLRDFLREKYGIE
jgi:hypothetical protein